MAEGLRQCRVESSGICSALGQEKRARALPWLPWHRAHHKPCGPPLAHCPKGPSGRLIQHCCSGPPWLCHRTDGSLSCQRSESCPEGGPQRLGRPSQTEIPRVFSEQEKGATGQELESKRAARLQSPESLSAPRRVGGRSRHAVGRMLAKESRSVSWGGVPLC